VVIIATLSGRSWSTFAGSVDVEVASYRRVING
jgi:hypothetical protein